MSDFLTALKEGANYDYTENGSLTHKSTLNAVYDMFALGGAYRNRSDEDVILLFKNAFEENPTLAVRCLFYHRDIQGQGERRFFRVCLHWLAKNYPVTAELLITLIPEYGRWDDLYCFVQTPIEDKAFIFMKGQLVKDLVNVQSNLPPSLLGKWLKSINSSSKETRKLGNLTRKYFDMTSKQYRKTLAYLRERINIVEKLMSQGRWDEIHFDKLPSLAGLRYSEAFARNDITKDKYKAFINDKNNKVNAGALYPYNVVKKALYCKPGDEVEIQTVEKYWNNLTNYFNGCRFNGIAVVDTSGSMECNYGSSIRPIDVAISLGMYCAERAQGPFYKHYISFSSRPQLVKVEGVNFVDKVRRIYKNCIVENTNIEATFDLMLNTAIKNNCSNEDIPQNIIVISDMEFDAATTIYENERYGYNTIGRVVDETLMEGIARKWGDAGYTMPHLIYWNVDARDNRIPDLDSSRRISYVSGASPSIFKYILSGKSGIELCNEVLNSERYKNINI